MNKRFFLTVLATVGAALVLSASVVSTRWNQQQQMDGELAELRARRDMLRDSVTALMAHDPIISFARTDSSSVAVALSESVVVSLIQDLTTQYLGRFEIDLTAIKGFGEGEVNVKVPLFGQMKAGEWKVRATVNKMSATLAAQEPTVEVAGTNRLNLALPIVVQGGSGNVTLDFAWNSKSIFNIVCRDFKTTQTVSGRILPQRHVARGAMILSAGQHAIHANPEFPPEQFALSMDLNPESWERVRQALEEQDRPSRCGLMMKPDSLIRVLRATGLKGLLFKLPPPLLRTIVFPTSVYPSVRILKSSVRLDVTPHQLRVSPGLFWYSADIDAQRSEGPGIPLPLPAPAQR